MEAYETFIDYILCNDKRLASLRFILLRFTSPYLTLPHLTLPCLVSSDLFICLLVYLLFGTTMISFQHATKWTRATKDRMFASTTLKVSFGLKLKWPPAVSFVSVIVGNACLVRANFVWCSKSHPHRAE